MSMEISLVEGKIYIAIDLNKAPDWDPFNQYDASPDGLSGKKEGFYLANMLCPFKTPFLFHGISISVTHYPICLDTDHFSCKTCRFFERKTCPIWLDKKNFDLTHEGFCGYKYYLYKPRGIGRRDGDLFNAIQTELLSHGRPLHYSVLTSIVHDRHPELKVAPDKVNTILRINPIFFCASGKGVYHAYPGVQGNLSYFRWLYC